jgi:predicted nucleotidyltransferase
MDYNLEWLQNNKEYILYDVLYGSHVYGTATEFSDKDTRGVFILPRDTIFGLDYVPQINDNENNIVYYEIGRFCELLLSCNTTTLEMLNTPNDCVLYKSDMFERIFLNSKDMFLTKDLVKSLVSMSRAQIRKATGLKKKMNFEDNQILRKTPLDFCYVPYKQGSQLLVDYLEERNATQDNCGLTKVPNMRDSYCLFYSDTIPYKGIIKKDSSNDIALSSIPKGEQPLLIMTYNKDAYTVHCKEYREYNEWLEKRNINRYVDVDKHKQKIDGKNMLHCVRVIETIDELLTNGSYNVRRSNRDYLLDIRKGVYPLQTIVDNSNNILNDIENKIENSNLKDSIAKWFIEEILIKSRTEYYEL